MGRNRLGNPTHLNLPYTAKLVIFRLTVINRIVTHINTFNTCVQFCVIATHMTWYLAFSRYLKIFHDKSSILHKSRIRSLSYSIRIYCFERNSFVKKHKTKRFVEGGVIIKLIGYTFNSCCKHPNNSYQFKRLKTILFSAFGGLVVAFSIAVINFRISRLLIEWIVNIVRWRWW